MSSYLADDEQDERCNTPALYELMAVAVHTGTIDGGHYIAYAKKDDGFWYCMNDERVGKVSKEEVLQ
jgi:ubiquitin C-terminal hydrolase